MPAHTHTGAASRVAEWRLRCTAHKEAGKGGGERGGGGTRGRLRCSAWRTSICRKEKRKHTRHTHDLDAHTHAHNREARRGRSGGKEEGRGPARLSSTQSAFLTPHYPNPLYAPNKGHSGMCRRRLRLLLNRLRRDLGGVRARTGTLKHRYVRNTNEARYTSSHTHTDKKKRRKTSVAVFFVFSVLWGGKRDEGTGEGGGRRFPHVDPHHICWSHCVCVCVGGCIGVFYF